MSANFAHPSVTRRNTAQAEAPHLGTLPESPGMAGIDWRAARLAGRACCCPARPTVIAVMPPTAARPHPTDLLLCGHHYRESRRALHLAGATVLDMAGRPVGDSDELWTASASA
jgi:hypothetical protein